MLRIKRLSLQGFKSFAQLSSFEPHHAITAIVGPNGSGKSNLVDALAFVIGESQQKTIRTSRIEDVIFAGSSDLHRADHSEVRLEVLDLDKGDEYFVTRRLFTGGTSEYLLNAKSVRLKELSSLLVEHNLEGEGSFIISQGEVEKQLVSTAIDLRKWFDDVLGLTFLLDKRRITLNKIDKNSDNLAVIQNLVIEFEHQIKNLQVQSVAAQRYRKLKHNQDVLAYKELSIDINHLKSNISKIKTDRDEFDSKHQNLVAEIEVSTQRLEEVKLELKQKEELRKFKQEEYSDERVQFEQAKAQVDQLKFKYQSIDEELQKTKVKAEVALADERKFRLLESELKKSWQILVSSYASAKEALEITTSQKSEADDAFKILDKEYFERKIEIDQLEREIRENTKSHANLKSQLLSLDNRIEILNTEIESITKLIDQTRTDSLTKSLHAEQINLDKINLELTTTIEDLQKNQSELDLHSSKSRKLQDQLARYNGELARLETQDDTDLEKAKRIFLAKHDIKPIQFSELCDYNEDALPFIELAFHSILRAYVVTSQELVKAKSAEEVNQLPPTDFIVVNNIDELSEKIRLQYITGPKVILQDIENTKNFEGATHWVQVSKNHIRLGSGMSPVQDSLKRTKRIKELNSIILELENAKSALDTSIQDLSARVKFNTDARNKYQSQLSSTRQAVQKYTNELKNLEESNKKYIEKLNRNKVLVPELLETKQNLVKTVNFYEDKLAEIKANFEAARIVYEDLKVRVDDAKIRSRDINLLQKQADEQSKSYQNQLNKNELDTKVLSTKLENSVLVLSELENITLELKSSLERLTKELAIAEKQPILSLDSELSKHKDYIITLDAEIKEHRKQADDLYNYMRRIELERVQLESKKYRYEEDHEAFINQLALLQERLESSSLDIDAVNSLELDLPNFDLPETEWVSEHIDLEKISKRKLKELVIRIENALAYLGSVNLLAEPQLKELETKLESYNLQIIDLQKAQENLLQSESELKSEAVKRLEIRLRETEKQFQTIFKTLFGSGSCNIKLQDPKDLLYSPIEVQVQLPGKKTTNLNLLSGGERSLLFIALFLAANSVASCGFLILDEVDAALDDANIIKFKRLVKEWSKQIQIIMVTHNRATMEIADKLIGVVNQPKGVSIIVPVELTEATKKFHYS